MPEHAGDRPESEHPETDHPEFAPLVVEPHTDAAEAAPRSRSGPPRPNRWLVAGALLIVGASAAIVLAAIGDDPRQESDTVPSTDVAPSTIAAVTLAPVVTTHPSGWTVIDVGDRVPSFPADSAVDGWVDWSIPEPVARFGGATEVVVLTADGVLHRIDVPTGRARSTIVPDVSTDGQIALTDELVAVPQFADVALVADDGSVTAAGVRASEPPRVVARGGVDGFLVLGGRQRRDGPERHWLLGSDGSAVPLADTAFTQADPWDRQFLPSGELLVDGPDGVDAIGVDGSTRRIERGSIVATGRNHYAVRRCAQTCEYTVVDASTGERTAATLDVLDDYRFSDTAVRLSPDGRYLQIADWRRQYPKLLLVAAADGLVRNTAELRSIRTPDAWASDSSGVFGTADGELAFFGVDGQVTVIEGLEPVRSVAARRLDRRGS